MYASLIVTLGAICAHFCETDSFLALRVVNKHWLYRVYSQQVVFKHFTLNEHWQEWADILCPDKERWKKEDFIFRRLSSFRHSIRSKEGTKGSLQPFFRLTTLFLTYYAYPGPLIKHRLPRTLVNLWIDMQIPSLIQDFDWKRHIVSLESLTLELGSAREFKEKTAFLLLLDELPQLERLKSLKILFKVAATLSIECCIRHVEHLERLLKALPNLTSFAWNMPCSVQTIKGPSICCGSFMLFAARRDQYRGMVQRDENLLRKQRGGIATFANINSIWGCFGLQMHDRLLLPDTKVRNEFRTCDVRRG